MIARPVLQQANELENRRRVIGAQIATAVTVALSALNLAGYLYMAASEMLVPMLEAVGKYIFFPFAALTSIMYAVFAWYHYSLERTNHLLFKAIVETIGAVAMTIAVIGFLAFEPLFAIAGPVIFATFLGLKTLFQLGTAIYYGCMALATNDHVLKHEYRNKVKHAILSTVAGALTTFALIAVELVAMPYLAIFGILAGAFAAACAVVRIIDSVINLRAVQNLQVVERAARDDIELGRTNNALIMEEMRSEISHARSSHLIGEGQEIEMQDMSVSLAEEPLPAVANDGYFAHEVDIDEEWAASEVSVFQLV